MVAVVLRERAEEKRKTERVAPRVKGKRLIEDEGFRGWAEREV